jgi:two-component system cell cycle sensor histidine kinase/response regulator CckA
VNDVSPSQPSGGTPPVPNESRPLTRATSSFVLPLHADSPGTDALQNTPVARSKTAHLSSVSDPQSQIKKLQDEVAECRQGLAQWIEAEATWIHQRRLFKVMTENVTDLIVLLDPQGNRVWNNPAYSHVLGYSSEEIAGTNAYSEVHPDDRARAMEAFDHAATRKTTCQAEYRMQQKAGGWLHLQTEIVPILSSAHEIESLVLMGHDVTEKKKLEEALTLSSTQLTGAGMVEKMAHDFDLLLTNIFGNLTIARNLNGPHNAVAVRLTEMERSLQRARDLIEQIFSLSPRNEQPKVAMAIEPLVHEAVNSVLRGTMVRAEYTFARNLPDLELDLEGFSHAIRNLVTNSLQATDKGVIRITAEYVPKEQFALRSGIPVKAGNYVCLRIQDQGHGMTEKTLLHAFEPYFTTRPGSQGLGLTTALTAIQRMGGTILIESTPSVGTTTYVYLPTLLPPTTKGRAGTSALPKPGEKRRILLMDDEQMILDIVSRMLTHLGYEVSVSTDGSQAIAAFAKAKSGGHPFDAVLMDLVIPNGVGGQDAVHTIRKIDPTAKVIASSGHLEHPAMTDYKKFGFSAVLEKPYKLERLQQVIDAVIDSPV